MAKAIDFHAEWSQYKWLWFLRRLVDAHFAGSIETTARYDRCLAEALASHIAADAAKTPSTDGSFPLRAEEAQAVAQLIGYAKALSQLHVTYRWCGKGATLRMAAPMPAFGVYFPQAEVDDALREAVTEYDRRIADSVYSGRLGAPVLPGVERGPINTDHLIGVGRIKDGPTPFPIPVLDPDGEVWANYRPSVMPVDSLKSLMAEEALAAARPWSADIPVLLGILHLGVLVFAEAHPIDQANIVRMGYVILPSERIESLWNTFRGVFAEEVATALSAAVGEPIAAIDDLPAAAAAIRPGLWPPKNGHFYFTAGNDHAVLDLHGATLRVFAEFSYPTVTGDLANIRARAFEDATQRIIDESPWGPPDILHGVAGRDLYLPNQSGSIGEIDAIGCSDGRLLIVSCKSLLYTDTHDRGEFSAVRNARTTVEQAVIRWDTLLAVLRDNPIGRNYNFNDLHALVGVVVTSRPVFVTGDLCRKECLPGLKKCCTFEELEEWLSPSR